MLILAPLLGGVVGGAIIAAATWRIAYKRGYDAGRRWSSPWLTVTTRNIRRYRESPFADAFGYAAAQGFHDLAVEFEIGKVSPDGSIWKSPGVRMRSGVLRVTPEEARKAMRFGWCRLDPDVGDDGLVWVTRS